MQGVKPRDVELTQYEALPHPLALGVADGAIEVDQDIALQDLVAVAEVNRGNDSRLQWLNCLGSPGWHDLPLRRRDDVDMAENRPGDGDGKEQDDGAADGASDRGCRCFEDLQGRSQ